MCAPFALADGVYSAWSDACATEIAREDRAQLAVLVTGRDTGFGRALALELVQRGYTVFAGRLQPEADASSELLHVCKMDVTSDADVDATAERVRAWVEEAPGRRLLSVVSNAGVGTGGPFEWIPLSEYERDSAVNYIGCVRVVKAFMALLRRSSAASGSDAAPRVVVVSSMSGKLPVPMLSSYAATKHAVSAFAASLRMELGHTWGIHVCTVHPSFHTTPLTQSGVPVLSRLWDALPPHTKALYGDACAASCLHIADDLMEDWAWDAARVTESLARLVSQERPPPAELAIGGDARFGLLALRHLPPALYEKLIWWVVAWNFVAPVKTKME